MIHAYDFLDTTWYWTSYAYADEDTAELAFKQLTKLATRNRQSQELGYYRHGSDASGMIIVTALGLKKSGVELADKALGAQAFNGFDDLPDERVLEALIARRVRVVHRLLEEHAPDGRYIRTGDALHLRPDGTVEGA